jgi:hypothetical protein
MDARETILRKTIPVVINSFNQPTYLENIYNKFKLNSFKNIIILDNLSSFKGMESLYEKLRQDGATIFYYGENNGPRYFHYNGAYKILDNIPHLYTDPDIDFDILNDKFLSLLIDLSNRYSIFKVGSALEIPSEEDIKPDMHYIQPNTNGKKVPIIEWESQFWKEEVEPGIYNSPIDTTLHLFNPIFFTDREKFITGLRVALNGFIVRHSPWYKNDTISSDERVFYKATDKDGWSNY